MILISILTLIVAKAIPSLNSNITNIGFTRISAIVFIFSGALTFNALYFQSIGSGIGIYSGLFHITEITQSLELFLLIIGSLILVSWPLISYNRVSKSVSESPKPKIKGLNESTDYSLIVLFSTLGSCLLISSSDLISLYLSIELQSFGVYILSSLYRDSESSISAGLKYFLLGGLSSCIILLGAGLIYAYTGLTNLEALYSLISVYASTVISGGAIDFNFIIQGFSLGLILIIIGFLFKIAAAPLHNWSPDVYDEVPTIVTIWLTIMPKIAILILLLELQTQIGLIGQIENSLNILNTISHTNQSGLTDLSSTVEEVLSPFSLVEELPKQIQIESLKEEMSTGLYQLISPKNSMYILQNILLISSVLSLIIGSVVGLAQTKIKRLLAYSTISHIGFMLLALAINTEQSINSFLFYLIQYTITNLNLFLIIIALGYLIKTNSSIKKIKNLNKNINIELDSNHSDFKKSKSRLLGLNLDLQIKDISYISELKAQFFTNPFLTLSFAISLFSMAGIPPLIGFFSKQYVLSSAMQSGYFFISLLAIILSIISASYYLKIITVLYTTESSEEEVIKSDLALVQNVIPNNLSNSPQSLSTSGEKKYSCSETANNIAKKGSLESVQVPEEELIPGLESESLKNNLLEKKDIVLTNYHSFLIASLTLIILLFILKPSLILNSTLLLSLSIFNF